NLCEDHLALIMRISVEEPAKCLELLRQSLGVVETVDANDAVDRSAGLGQAARALDFSEIRQVDTDRKTRYRYEPFNHPDTSIGHDPAKRSLGHVVEQVSGVRRGLHTNQIIGGERTREFFVLWDCHERLPGWEGDVQKKA